MNLLRKNKDRYPVLGKEYPTHICIQTPDGLYYLNGDKKRYRITSREVFESWSFDFVVDALEDEVKHYPVAVTNLSFRNGSLLYNIKDATLYIVSGSMLRQITSPDVLRRLGLSFDDALVVSNSDINSMKKGSDLS